MAESPVKKRLLKRTTAQLLMVGGGAAAALLIVVGLGWYLYANFSDRAASSLRSAQSAVVAELALELARELQPAFEAVATIGNSNGAVRGARGDSAARALLEQKAAEIPGLLKLRLLPPGYKEVDNTSSPPLQYGSLDMLRRSEASEEPIPAEVHLFGTPAQHLVVVRRIMDGGQFAGFVHASFDIALLQRSLDTLDSANAHLELQQPLQKGEPKVIAQSAGARPDDLKVANTPLNGTALQLAYWGTPSRGAIAQASAPADSGGGWLVVLAAALLVAAAVGAGLFFFKRGRRINIGGGVPGQSPIAYEGAIRAIMEGAHPGLERLVPGLPSLPAAATAAPRPATPVLGELDGDDITAFAPSGSGPNVDSDPTVPEPEPATDTGSAAEADADGIAAVIFRTYDIRGVVGESLTADAVYEIGRALGSEAYDRGQQGLVVARDGRTSSPELAEALIKGLREVGRDVIDIGLAPTPVLYFATHYLDTLSGVMVTGSHNPPDYNGLKIVLDGETLSGEAIQAIRQRIESRDYTSGSGNLQTAEMVPEYVRRISDEIPVALGNAFKIVIDCGNGVAGAVAPQMMRALGHDVVELYCDVDGSFPNHHPDPSQPDNLEDLIDMVKLENADLGLAFDGDGDRLGVVDGTGKILWPDQQMILFVKDVLSRNTGAPIIYDVKCSRHLAQTIEANGGKPVMWKTGHSLIKNKMKEIDAPLAGEMSGHIFFKERWYGFDDAIYAASRLVEILLNEKRAPAEVFAELPGGVTTPELRIDMPETKHTAFMEQLVSTAAFDSGETTTIDGLRVDFANGWGLVRPSNTTPCLVLRFEGDDEQSLKQVQEQFRQALLGVQSDLKLPF